MSEILTMALCFSEVLTESLDFLDEKVDILEGGSRVGDDHAEEVDLVSLGLVAHHRAATLHHHGFDFGCHLAKEHSDEDKVRSILQPHTGV